MQAAVVDQQAQPPVPVLLAVAVMEVSLELRGAQAPQIRAAAAVVGMMELFLALVEAA
jgi:hypothetical protein